ncbi:MAG TPA: hypothetical protein VMT37_13515 [Solirubrobacterales bacterium]|nr:hypothetical protein [Solirubrobacterales bacterium]
MRPVNLIPPEDRRGSQATLRGGPLAYVVVAALAALLLGVVLLVNAGNEVSERKSELTQIESEAAKTREKAASLAAYITVDGIHKLRAATVTDLANSRFDWERVIRELSLIIPGDVWLTNLTGTVAPDVAVNGAASIALRDGVPGPALEILGCGKSQDAVAGFISDLKQIDGVTRVAVQSSKLPGSEVTGAEDEAAAASGCQTRKFIAQFEIVAAFDAAPAAPEGT